MIYYVDICIQFVLLTCLNTAVFENTPKYSKLCMYRHGELSLLLVILLGLASQIKIFEVQSELKIS
jgi:hypothetical protein